MPEEKGTAKKQAAKKDFIDFIREAAQDHSRISEFLDKITDEGTNKADLRKFLHGLGYKGVSVNDCVAILHAARRDGAWRTVVEDKLQRDY